MTHVARSLTPEDKVKSNILHSMVYALYIFHCCMNAGIQKSNIGKFFVQWAKTANLEDQERKFKQLHTTGITRNQWAYIKENWKDVGIIHIPLVEDGDDDLTLQLVAGSSRACGTQ